MKIWSQQELADQVVRLTFETKEDRGTRLDVRLVGRWETGSVRRPQSVYRRLLSGLGAPIPVDPSASAQPLPMMKDQEPADSGRISVDEASSTSSTAALRIPELSTVVEMDEGQGERIKRRAALLATITAAVGGSGIGSVSALLANLVRHDLLDSADAVEDWDAVVEDFSRRLVTDPSADYGEALLAQLIVAGQQNIDLGATADRLRAVAQLASFTASGSVIGVMWFRLVAGIARPPWWLIAAVTA